MRPTILAIITALLLLTGGAVRAAEATSDIFEVIKANDMARLQTIARQ